MEDSHISETIKDLIRESEKVSFSLPRVSESVTGWGSRLTPNKLDNQDSHEKLTTKINPQRVQLKKKPEVHNPRMQIKPSKYPELQFTYNPQKCAKPWRNFKPIRLPKKTRHPKCTCLSLQQSPKPSCLSPVHIPKHDSLNYSEFPRREQKHNRFQFDPIDFNREIANHILTYRKTLREMLDSPISCPVSRTPALRTKYKRVRQFSWGNEDPSVLKS